MRGAAGNVTGDVAEAAQAGDKFYLDALRKNHIEIFYENEKAKAVLNLDGSVNADKTQKPWGKREG